LRRLTIGMLESESQVSGCNRRAVVAFNGGVTS
jgi:hypothetical protein